jgi:hypothetical protein
MQVAITGRKRLISPSVVAAYKKNRTKSDKKDSSDEFDYDEESHESRKRRRRRRRQFLDSFASDVSTSEAETSLGATSTTSYETLNSSDESAATDATNDTINEDDPEVEGVHMMALERLTLSKINLAKRGGFQPKVMKVETLKRRTAFGILSLGVMLSEGNSLTLGDLIRYANSDALSYSTSVQNVPLIMKIKDPHDLLKFSGQCDYKDPLDHLKQRRLMSRLGSLLDLKQVDLGQDTTLVKTTLARYLRELSLPATLGKVLFNSLRKTALFKLAYTFGPYSSKKKYEESPIVSADARSLAIILFGLKYLYGLDDVTEKFRSASPDTKKFNPLEWMRLSRHRAFLACKHSCDLHRRMTLLFGRDQVSLSGPAWMASLKQTRNKIVKLKTFKRERKFCKGDEDKMEMMSDFINESLASKFNGLHVNSMDLSHSKWPLHDFALHFCSEDILEDAEEHLDPEDIEQLQRLLDMYELNLGLRSAASEAKVVDVKPVCVMASLSIACVRDQVVFAASNSLEPEEEAAKEYNFEAKYWRAKLTDQKLVRDREENHSPKFASYLLSLLPENFGWILRYLSAVSGLRITEIYFELLNVEQSILDQDPGFFGMHFRNSKVSKVQSLTKMLEDKLTC